jgi:hypothetical protein
MTTRELRMENNLLTKFAYMRVRKVKENSYSEDTRKKEREIYTV